MRRWIELTWTIASTSPAHSMTALAPSGVTQPDDDLSLSDDVRDAVLGRLVTADGPVAEAAVALDAVLGQSELSDAETALMREWLARLTR